MNQTKEKSEAMGTVITVMNMKGGVGKTTVAMHMAGITGRYKLNERVRKVLLIDYDPQFNVSQAFIPARKYFELEKKRKTTISILLEDDTDLDPYRLQVPGNENPPKVSEISYSVYRSRQGNCLDIIPSTLDLMYVALGQPGKKTRPIEERFNKFIDESRGLYDLIFIDCHPAGSLFTKTSLACSDHVLIPVVPQRYAVRGIGLMLRFIKAKKIGTPGPKPHILFNLTSRLRISDEEKEIRSDSKFQKLCMNETLKYFKAFSDPLEGKGFVWVSEKPYSTQAFGNLSRVTREFLHRIENRG